LIVYFVTTLLQIFHEMCRWKKFRKAWTKVCGLLFWATL